MEKFRYRKVRGIQRLVVEELFCTPNSGNANNVRNVNNNGRLNNNNANNSNGVAPIVERLGKVGRISTEINASTQGITILSVKGEIECRCGLVPTLITTINGLLHYD